MELILASASPRRQELLKQIGLTFKVQVSDVEEIKTTNVPAKLVQHLAKQKALDVFQKAVAQAKDAAQICVIGADTVVALEGEILGKPGSYEEAFAMLRKLSGKTHQVYTGVCLCFGETSFSFYEETAVTFMPMSDAEIEDYLATGESFDKAGAYGIQGQCAKFISGMDGDYYNVMGLPVCQLYQTMKTLGIL